MYNSVPTNNSELTVIPDVVHRGISYAEFNRFRITPFIIGQRIIQLKTRKDDGSEGFNSNLIMYICDDFVYTSEMQFGFKQNNSPVLCSIVYKEVVSNYLQNGSTVYS